MEMREDGQDVLVPPPKMFMGVPIHPVTPSQLINILSEWGNGRELRRVYNVNVHAMNLAAELPDFKKYLQDADLVFCDGFGVQFMARVTGINIPRRMTPPDWIDDLADKAAKRGQSIFALGEEEGVAARFMEMICWRHPGLVAAGSHHGFFEKSGSENDAIIEKINASGATFLLVGFGMPLQERWIEQNAHALRVKVALSVGALFRWYTGYEKRPPRWVTDLGLEWLARFIRHPVRHFRRYAIGNPRFVARVLRSLVNGKNL